MVQKHIDIRPFRTDEADSYSAIRLMALETNPEAFGSTAESERARGIEYFESKVKTGRVFGGFEGGRCIGMAGYYPLEGEKFAHKAVLWGVFVAPCYRGRNLASLLVRAVLGQACTEVEVINLSVVANNAAAIAVYGKHGFRAYGTEPKALKLGSVYVDEVLMSCDLSETMPA